MVSSFLAGYTFNVQSWVFSAANAAQTDAIFGHQDGPHMYPPEIDEFPFRRPRFSPLRCLVFRIRNTAKRYAHGL